MTASHAKILIGCNEPSVVQTIKVLLANAHQDGTAFNFTESRRCDDFILKGSTGDYRVTIIYPNCLTPSQHGL